ncbi:MAG: lipopolysaccharide biosynthesis protein [Luteimonas sp.]
MAPWLAVAFLMALAGTFLGRRYALRKQLLDQPGIRRSHDTPTPRGGGIAIVAAMVPVFSSLIWPLSAHSAAMAAIGAGLFLVAAIGWLDDHRPQSPWSRLLVQMLAAGLLGLALLGLGASPAKAACGWLLAMVLVNAWNFMDGIDGLAASQAMLAASAYALFVGTGPALWLGLSLAACCAGFLPLNRPHARIFLGDVGSGALGYLIAVLASLALLGASWRHAPLLLLPVMGFGVDTGLTLARRVLRGERWWLPHVQHAYQAWARHAGHGLVTAAFFVWTLAGCGFMLAAGDASFTLIMLISVTWCLAACAAWLYLQRSRGCATGVEG